MLLEVCKAAAQGRAPGINDARVRQDQLNETDMKEVAGHFVNEALPAENAVGPCLREISFAECREIFAGQANNRLRISGGFTGDHRRTKFVGNPRNIGQLARALHVGMTGEDLFQQRRTRARQTNYKNGIGRGAAAAVAGREELLGVQRKRALGEAGIDFAIVLNVGAPQSVAAAVMREGVAKISGVLQRFAERELELQPLAVVELRPCRLRFHRLEVADREAKGLQVRETEPRFAGLGPKFRALTISGYGLAQTPGSAQ